MKNSTHVHQENVVPHPTMVLNQIKQAYKESNIEFINTFECTKFHFRSASLTTAIEFSFKQDLNLTFIEFEKTLQETGLLQTDNDICDTGIIRLKGYAFEWKVVCLDSTGNVILKPLERLNAISKRQLDLKIIGLNTSKIVDRIYKHNA